MSSLSTFLCSAAHHNFVGRYSQHFPTIKI
nr:MAG TPA: hypothetical protein [Caudoviricetes sp.]